MKLAAILTCYNRKEKTLSCLRSLYAAINEVEVYLTDDGCTDGTPEAVSSEFPNVHIVPGDGSLFWSRGMYTAWKEALDENHTTDYYLWLNDDVELYPFFLEELLKCEQLAGGDSVVSGIIEDFDKKGTLYGGYDANKNLLVPNGEIQDITLMNGNVVLVPQSVVDKIGIIDPTYHHDLGDLDYGLTAIKNGLRVVTTTRAVAAGYSNNICRVRKWGTSISNRFKKLNSPLGSPLNYNYYFRKKHYGIVKALGFCLKLIILNILSDRQVSMIWGNTYKDK